MDSQTCSQCNERAMDNGSGLCEPHFEARRDAIRADLHPAPPAGQRYRSPAAARSGLTIGRVLRIALATVIVAPLALYALAYLIASVGFDGDGVHSVSRGEARVAVKALLRDPSSAEFSDEVVGRNGVACGRVNAKNGFGGYVGAQRYIYVQGASALLERSSGLIDFEAQWQKNCR